jgi:hypothetical protein
MANLVWAVERLIEGPAEQALNRFEAYLEQKRRHEQESLAPPKNLPEALHYQLTTEVPDYWVPLLPVRTEQGLRFKRGAVLKTDAHRNPLTHKGVFYNRTRNYRYLKRKYLAKASASRAATSSRDGLTVHLTSG